MTDLSQRPFGPSGQPLARLDDRELQAEARRRRAARRTPTHGAAAGPLQPTSAPSAVPPQGGEGPPRHVRQWYANLEIPAGSDLSTVEAAYERLVRRYDPERHRDDPDRHRAALDLTRSLTRAYRGLAAYLGSPTPPR